MLALLVLMPAVCSCRGQDSGRASQAAPTVPSSAPASTDAPEAIELSSTVERAGDLVTISVDAPDRLRSICWFGEVLAEDGDWSIAFMVFAGEPGVLGLVQVPGGDEMSCSDVGRTAPPPDYLVVPSSLFEPDRSYRVCLLDETDLTCAELDP